MRHLWVKYGLILAGAAQFLPSVAQARPEYALKQHVGCTACHVNPWGGGPRTIYGKVYGSRDYGLAKTSTTDLFYGDLRAIAFYPPKPTKNSSGVALMEAAASANVPVTQSSDGKELRVVATFNLSPLQSGPREGYLRWKTAETEDDLVSYVMLGRFNAPFGLLTDEHRTYTRLQTNMTLNNYEMGGSVSGTIIEDLHYDLALTNDFQNGGGAFVNNNVIWGAIFNTRWMPGSIPILVGASQNYEHILNQPQPFATSVYAGLSLDRLTQNKLHGSLLAEGVLAKNWNDATLNPALGPFFIPSSDSAYQTAISESRSRGFYIQAKYDLSARWTLIYKFDYLDLDANYDGDAFSRHGLGFEVFLASNLILDSRVEKAFVGRPEISGTAALAAQDDFLAMLRLWL